MKTFTIRASQTVADIPLSAHDVQRMQGSSVLVGSTFQSIGVMMEAGSHYVIIETRPVAADKAKKTQRLNRALQVGYFIPTQETFSKV
jgi:hypothetical protein